MTPLAIALRTARYGDGPGQKMSQRDVAAMFGIAQASYSRWESGVDTPDPTRRRAVARFLGMAVSQVDALIAGEPDPFEARLARIEADYIRLLAEVENLTKAIKADTKARKTTRV
jgi:transcriptional regulator with XRE-family HTH domain